MAWIFLAASEDFQSHSESGLSPSPIVRSIGMPRLSSCLECTTGPCIPRRSGTMLEPSEAQCCQKSISSTEVSHARISLLQEMERVWREREANFFLKSSDWLASFDRGSYSWKTCQLSLIEDLSEFVWSSLRSGMIVAGRLYQPVSLEPHTCAKGGGYFPTILARDFKSPGVSRTRKANLKERRSIPLSLWFKETYGISLHPIFGEWMMGYRLKHTALSPWAMQWFRNKRKKHLKDY